MGVPREEFCCRMLQGGCRNGVPACRRGAGPVRAGCMILRGSCGKHERSCPSSLAGARKVVSYEGVGGGWAVLADRLNCAGKKGSSEVSPSAAWNSRDEAATREYCSCPQIQRMRTVALRVKEVVGLRAVGKYSRWARRSGGNAFRFAPVPTFT